MLSAIFGVSVITSTNYQSGRQIRSHAITLDSPQTLYLHGNFSTSSCAAPRSTGSWSDGSRWLLGVPPTSTDTVILPSGTGVVNIAYDVSFKSLKMFGGLLVSYSSACPYGWTPYTIRNTVG
jgi:hypothetical protein